MPVSALASPSLSGIATSCSKRLQDALALPGGARFYRCALQVNPFGYLSRNAKPIRFPSEAAYNEAMVAACLEQGIEVIAVTDHYRVDDSASLIAAARSAGIHAFGGFEAVTKEGVHFLCLFDPAKEGALERFIGECGVHDSTEASPTGSLDSEELLHRAKQWGAVCIAAHVASSGGLLKTLSGKPRAKVWTSPLLLACSLPGPLADAPQGIRQILQNKDAQYRRLRPVALLNAQDVSDPEDLARAGGACWIKMSHISVEGLRQAFLDSESRVRIAGDSTPEPHAEFIAISWEGGFLDEMSIHFNESLNVLVGGRGVGKSTIIESLRYVLGLEPGGEEASKIHQSVMRSVLRNGTRISLLVRSPKPSPRIYTIERTIPNPPMVRDEQGNLLNVSPRDVVPAVDVFGQHEISELTRSPEKLTRLLLRFVDVKPSLQVRKSRIKLDLERARTRALECQHEIAAVEERLATLPALEERLKRFQVAGLEERLSEKSLLIREEGVLQTVADRTAPFRELHRKLAGALAVNSSLVSPEALEGLPNADVLGRAFGVLQGLAVAVSGIAEQLAVALKEADAAMAEVRASWDTRRACVESTYEKLLRDLQKSNIDGEEFVRLRRQLEELRPLRERHERLLKDQAELDAQRRELLADWENIKGEEYRAMAVAAARVSKELRDRVRVEVRLGGLLPVGGPRPAMGRSAVAAGPAGGHLDPLEKLLREWVGGNLNASFERLRAKRDLSLPELAAMCREGKESLVKGMGLPPSAAERITQGGAELFMRIEELELPVTTSIELNTAAEGRTPVWQALDALSTGQKATAILLLLLLESDAPLVVDQPEDDLDNRFITDGVVPIMKREKRRRQFVFSSHNANIPVLADAELIVGLTASGEAHDGRSRIRLEHRGSIDSGPVRELVEEILEGGKTAFETRRLKYGF
jgi:hypothetical protein